MNIKEEARIIFDNFSEEQLEAFVTLCKPLGFDTFERLFLIKCLQKLRNCLIILQNALKIFKNILKNVEND